MMWLSTCGINRYLFARLFCWGARKLGYAVMLYPDHFGHQAGDVEFDLRTKKQKLLYLAGTIPNKALRKMQGRRATIIDLPVWLRAYFIEAQIAYDCLDESLWRQLVFYDRKDVWGGKPQLEFSKEEREYGDSVLRMWGLEKGQYVCFHARDAKYGGLHHPEVIAKRRTKRMVPQAVMTEEHPFQKHRNVDFAGYFKAIGWLETQGIKAVRLGSDVEQKQYCGNLIDYAGDREGFADPELLDLYLMAHCKLYVGHGSGVTHLSCIWNTPGVCVNWFPYLPGSRPTANITACRVKKLKVLGETLSEFRSRHFFELADWQQIYAMSEQIEVIDNTPDEILETVQAALGFKTEKRAA